MIKVIDKEIELGDLARCKISGFVGTIVSITHNLYGSPTVSLAPNKLDFSDQILPGWTMSIEQVEVITEIEDENKKGTK